MNTPDTEEKVCGVIVTSNTGMKDGHACFNKRPCPVHTPDTGWEKTVRGKVRSAMYLAECHELQYQAVEPIVFELLASRDTYWKERVRKEVEGMRKAYPTVQGTSTMDDWLRVDGWNKALDTLLDNLK